MPGLNFSLLGRLQIERYPSGIINLTNRKAIALLAYLLIESEHAHSREFLLGLLWPDLPTAAAQNNLRVTWAHLQKVLGKRTADAQPTLLGDRLALRFNPHSAYDLDVARFRALIEACRRHRHSDPHTCAECAARLTAALALVRGAFLDEFSLSNCPPFDEWLLLQREHFHVQVTAALEQLAAFHERSGHLAAAEQTIRRLLDHDPLSEAAYRQLMRVLAQSAQRSAALEIYATCRRVLASELGLAPTIETVMLAEQIRATAPLAPQMTQTTLPTVLTRFLGRQQESARLVDLLAHGANRLVTLTGPGGVGKTRLAIDVAYRLSDWFTHHICFVELAGVTDGRAVDDAIAAALRLPTNSGRSTSATIVDYLCDKTMLLVLDNCEHLVKACASLVQTLCRAAAGLTVLATSRVPLHLAGEQVVRLQPLAVPTVSGPESLTVAESLRFDAIQLFTDRATQALLRFTLTDANVVAVARICQQLDGMPLAIEIAAAQARALPIAVIAERLGQRLAWLNKQAGEAVPRQRTLHTLIDWSYGLLSDHARTLLCRLAVFGGGWTLAAAEAVSAPGEPCIESLTELVDHSLIIFGNDAECCRYTMHETIRQFAEEQLRGRAQEAEVLERHARYYAQLVAQAAATRTGQTLIEQLRAIQHDHDNVRRAFEWLLAYDGEQALSLVAQLGMDLKFWELGGFFQEGRRWLQRALTETAAVVSLPRARALLAAAELSSAIVDFDYGLQCARQAQQLFQQLGNQQGDIDARLIYCDLADLAGVSVDLQSQVTAALRMAEQIAYTAGIAKGQGMLAILCERMTGDTAMALHYSFASVALWRTVQDPFELASALNNLGADLLTAQENVAARQVFLECREIYHTLRYQRGVALATHNLGCVALNLGETALARELLCDALRIRHALGLLRGYTYSFASLAQVDEKEERYDRAVQLLAAVETLCARIGAPLEPTEKKEQAAAINRLGVRLGAVVFERAWLKGTHLTTEQAIVLALR